MGITTDKLTVGKSVWSSCVKWASERSEEDMHKTSDIGILWAADRIAQLEAANRWISVEDDLPIYGECVNLFSNGVIQDQKWYLDSPPSGDDNPILWWANDEFEPNDWVALRPSDLWLIPPPPEAKQ